MKLEQIINIPENYSDMAVSDNNIIGMKLCDPYEHNAALFDLFDKDGRLLSQFGKQFYCTISSFGTKELPDRGYTTIIRSATPRSLYFVLANMSPFAGINRTGDVPLFGLIDAFITLLTQPFQIPYNLLVRPFQKLLMKRFANNLNYLSDPKGVCSAGDKIFVLDKHEYALFRAFGAERRTDAWLSIFDANGKPIKKKKLGVGTESGKIPLDCEHPDWRVSVPMRAFDGRLYIFDEGNQSVNEFDFDGQFLRVLNEEHYPICYERFGRESYDVGPTGVYLSGVSNNCSFVSGVSRDGVRHINFNGESEFYDLSDKINIGNENDWPPKRIDNIAVGDEHVYVRSGNRFLTYTPDMQFVQEDVIPEINDSNDFHDGVCYVSMPRMSYNNGKLYLVGNETAKTVCQPGEKWQAWCPHVLTVQQPDGTFVDKPLKPVLITLAV